MRKIKKNCIKFKQWWQTILPISTKRIITFHLKLFNTKRTTTYDVGNLGPGLCGRVKPIDNKYMVIHEALYDMCAY
jgi:hypothetical protein